MLSACDKRMVSYIGDALAEEKIQKTSPECIWDCELQWSDSSGADFGHNRSISHPPVKSKGQWFALDFFLNSYMQSYF